MAIKCGHCKKYHESVTEVKDCSLNKGRFEGKRTRQSHHSKLPIASVVTPHKINRRKSSGSTNRLVKSYSSQKPVLRRRDRVPIEEIERRKIAREKEEDKKLQRYFKVKEEEKKERDEERRKIKKSESVDAVIDEGRTDRIRKSMERRRSSSFDSENWRDEFR